MYRHIFLVYDILFVQSMSFEDTSLRYLRIGNMKENTFSGLLSVLICLVEYCQMRNFLAGLLSAIRAKILFCDNITKF